MDDLAASAIEEVKADLAVDAFSEFYLSFTPRLVNFLLWNGARLVEAADIAQEAMRRAYEQWDTIDHPKAWCRTVASREYGRRMTDVEIATAEPPVLLLSYDPDVIEQRHEVLRRLRQLPPRQRQVLAWTYDGYSPTEIAEELSISPEAVRSNLLKARRALAKQLEEPDDA